MTKNNTSEKDAMRVSLIDRLPRYCGRTMSGRAWVRCVRTTDGEFMRVLDVAGTYQSATYLDERWCEPTFPYHWLFDHVFDAWPEGDGPATMAILGGGGYAIPKHLVAHHPEVRRIDVVEFDPAIERIARRYFFLDRLEQQTHPIAQGRLHLHTADAYAWLEECDRRYDAILNDCFIGLMPEAAFVTVDAAQLIKKHLHAGGLYLTNVVSALDGPDSTFLNLTIATLRSSFSHIWVYACSPEMPTSRDNNIVVASNVGHKLYGANRHLVFSRRKERS